MTIDTDRLCARCMQGLAYFEDGLGLHADGLPHCMQVRGPAYFEDGKKIAAVGTPLCDFFGAQTFELNGEHLAGASATLLQAGVIVPPRSARFVLSLHFMNPRHSSNAPYNVLMIHSASDTAPAEAEGPSAALLRELWDGDATTAVSRLKVLAALRSGPQLVRRL